jgi:hypothetical protein
MSDEAEELPAASEELEEPEEMSDEAEELPEASEEFEKPEEMSDEAEELPEASEELEEPEEMSDEAESAEPITADSQKQSNIRLVFGDDDIPYIVETSGLELVDEDIDSVLNIMRADDDEPAALEELDEEEDGAIKDAGKTKELDALEKIESPPDISSGILSEEALENLTREIEYSILPSTDTVEDSLDNEFEIVSPFATILSDFSDDTKSSDTEESFEEEEPETTSGEEEEMEMVPEEVEAVPEEVNSQDSNGTVKLDELQSNTGSLIYKPFTTQEQGMPENLEALQDKEREEETGLTELPHGEDLDGEESLEPSEPRAVIEERDGISYVNKDILSPDEETVEKLDPGFQNLINSVLKKD